MSIRQFNKYCFHDCSYFFQFCEYKVFFMWNTNTEHASNDNLSTFPLLKSCVAWKNVHVLLLCDSGLKCDSERFGRRILRHSGLSVSWPSACCLYSAALGMCLCVCARYITTACGGRMRILCLSFHPAFLWVQVSVISNVAVCVFQDSPWMHRFNCVLSCWCCCLPMLEAVESALRVAVMFRGTMGLFLSFAIKRAKSHYSAGCIWWFVYYWQNICFVPVL